MKIVGKMGDKYTITATEEEIFTMITGTDNTYRRTDEQKEQLKELVRILQRGNEAALNIHEQFSRMVNLAQTKLADNNRGIKSILDTMQSLIKPVDDLVVECFVADKD